MSIVYYWNITYMYVTIANNKNNKRYLTDLLITTNMKTADVILTQW